MCFKLNDIAHHYNMAGVLKMTGAALQPAACTYGDTTASAPGYPCLGPYTWELKYLIVCNISKELSTFCNSKFKYLDQKLTDLITFGSLHPNIT